MTPLPITIKKVSAKEALKLYNELRVNPSNQYAFNSSVQPHMKAYETEAYYVIYRDQVPLGYIQGLWPKANDTFWLQIFVINPDFRRKGLGTSSYELFIELLQENTPLTKVYLTCYDANTVGHHFWQSLGFYAKAKGEKQTEQGTSTYTLYTKEYIK